MTELQQKIWTLEGQKSSLEIALAETRMALKRAEAQIKELQGKNHPISRIA